MNDKKSLLKKISLFLFFGLTILFSSCENFLSGNLLKNDLNDTIEYENAPFVQVAFESDPAAGSVSPGGSFKTKAGYFFDVSFAENSETHKFIKWVALKDGIEISEGIEIEDPSHPQTRIKVSFLQGITIKPITVKRVGIVGEPSPKYESSGVSRDRSITVQFSKPLSSDAFIFSEDEIPEGAVSLKNAEGKIWAYTLDKLRYFKNISITNSDDISIAEHFCQPVMDGQLLTVPVDKGNPIILENGSTFKTIKVSLSQNICDADGIEMGFSKNWKYQVTEATDEKATVTLTSESSEGSVYLAGTRDYNIGRKITLAFTEAADFQFIKWVYDENIIYIEESDSASTYAVVKEKTAEDSPSEIKAVCAPRLRTVDSEFKPKVTAETTSVGRNSTIRIKFNKPLPVDEEGLNQLKNITVTVGGTDIRSCFVAPVLNEDTVTFVSDRSNLLEVSRGQTKTVSVTIPADFYYVNESGIKVTYGGTGKTYNYVVDHTTESKSDVSFISTANSGSFVSESGTVYFSLNESSDLIYSMADGFVFDCWEITCSDPLFDPANIVIDDVKNISTKIHVYEAYAGVVVKAKCHKVFKASVIPEYVSSGVNCDSSVKIVFNKDVNEDCILNKGPDGKKSLKNIKICDPNNISDDYERYFDVVDFADNTLVLKPYYKIRELVPGKSDMTNIKIILENENIFDTEGYNLSSDENHIYRIKNDMETLAPVVNFTLFKASYLRDKQSGLTELKCCDLSVAENNAQTYHAGKSIYYDYSVEDFDSGLKSFTIEEELVKTVEGIDAYIKCEKYVFNFPLENERSIVSYKESGAEYVFKSEMEGMVKLTFTFEDYAGNKNESVYYVIKDAFISTAVISPKADVISKSTRYINGRSTGQSCLTSTGIQQLESYMADGNNKVTTKLDFTDIKKTYYKDSKTNLLFVFSWGYSKDELNNSFTLDGKIFSFVRDVKQDAFVKIVAYDFVGNKAEILRVIPKKLNMVNLEDSDNNRKTIFIDGIEDEALKCSEYNADDIGYLYFYAYQKNASSAIEYYVTPYDFPTSIRTYDNYMYFASGTNWSCDEYTPDGIYSIYVLPWFVYSERIYLGTLSDPFVYYHNVDAPDLSGNPDFPSDFNISLDEPVHNAGYRTVHVTLPSDFTKTPGFEYGVLFKNDNDSVYSFSGKFTFDIESSKRKTNIYKSYSSNYTFKLYAKNSLGKIFKASSEKKISVSGDNTPPSVYNTRRRIGLTQASSPQAFYLSWFDGNYFLSRPFDNNGMYKNAEGLVEIDAYLIKKEENNANTTEITRDMLSQYAKKTIVYDDDANKNTFIPLFFEDLPESYYVCVLDLKDNNEPEPNSALATFTCSNVLDPVILDISSTSEEGMYSFSVPKAFPKGTNFSIGGSIGKIDNDNWYKLYSIDGKISSNVVNLISLNASVLNGNFVRFCLNNGQETSFKSALISFLCPEYEANKGNPAFEVKQKSVIPSLGGSFLVFYDAPCFAHTLAYPTKSLADMERIMKAGNLSDTIPVWESKGREAGLKHLNDKWESGSISYYVPVDEIPEGYSYVTIFRFADGTAVMSDVNSK